MVMAHECNSNVKLFKIISEFPAATRVAQLTKSLSLNLSHAFTSDPEFQSYLFQCPCPAIFQAKSQLQHSLLPEC